MCSLMISNDYYQMVIYTVVLVNTGFRLSVLELLHLVCFKFNHCSELKSCHTVADHILPTSQFSYLTVLGSSHYPHRT